MVVIGQNEVDIVKAVMAVMARRAIARRSFRAFVPYIKDRYNMRWFHGVIADELQLVYERKISKLPGEDRQN